MAAIINAAVSASFAFIYSPSCLPADFKALIRIKLHTPEAGLAAIHGLGLRQNANETLRLAPGDAAGEILLRGKSGELLSAGDFAALHQHFGSWIDCNSARTQARVQRAMGVGYPLADQIKVAEGDE